MKPIIGGCLSCGATNKNIKIVDVDNGACVKCTECGLNTGRRKSYRLAINAWNQITERAWGVMKDA